MPAQTSYTMDPDRGVEGQLALNSDPDVKSMYNGEGATDMPFGRGVQRDTAVANGKAAKMMSGDNRVVGITVLTQSYENGPFGELSATGVKPGGQLDVVREGLILVKCEGGCTAGDRLFVRYAGGTIGALRATDAGGSTCHDATSEGEWQETGADGDLIWLSVDFLNK